MILTIFMLCWVGLATSTTGAVLKPRFEIVDEISSVVAVADIARQGAPGTLKTLSLPMFFIMSGLRGAIKKTPEKVRTVSEYNSSR